MQTKNKIITDNYDDFISKIVAFMIKEKFTSAIVNGEDIDEIIESLADQYSKVRISDIDTDDYESEAYLISKAEYKDEETVYIFVESIFRDGECIPHEDDYIIVDTELWSPKLACKINSNCDDITFIEFDYDNEECNCEECTNKCDCYSEQYEEDAEREFIITLAELVEEAMDDLENICCPDCQREALVKFACRLLEGFGLVEKIK